MPTLGAPSAGAESHASGELSKDLKKLMKPVNVADLPLAPPAKTVASPAKVEKKTAREIKKE